jgi:hypothetical protein
MLWAVNSICMVRPPCLVAGPVGRRPGTGLYTIHGAATKQDEWELLCKAFNRG